MDRTRIRVWDLPLRIFHWLLAATFAGAFMTAEAEHYAALHRVLGYAFIALLACRVLWAFVGTRYARLSSFAFGPAAVLRYLKSLVSRHPVRYVGHNPAGSWAIYALVLSGVLVGATGFVTYASAAHWLEELHEGMSNAMLGLVLLHLAGVVATSVLHRENLVAAMITGYKRAPASRDGGVPSA